MTRLVSSGSSSLVVKYHQRLMHPVLPSNYHWRRLCIRTSECCVCVQDVDITDLSEARVLPQAYLPPRVLTSVFQSGQPKDNFSNIISLLQAIVQVQAFGIRISTNMHDTHAGKLNDPHGPQCNIQKTHLYICCRYTRSTATRLYVFVILPHLR